MNQDEIQAVIRRVNAEVEQEALETRERLRQERHDAYDQAQSLAAEDSLLEEFIRADEPYADLDRLQRGEGLEVPYAGMSELNRARLHRRRRK